MREKFWIFWFTVTGFLRKKHLANICGHRTLKEGVTSSFNERYVIEMSLEDNGRPNYCLECIGKMAIRCGWCGHQIHIGSFVTPYFPKGEMPDYTVYDSDRPSGEKTVVGCERADCASSGGDYYAIWIPPGKVQRLRLPAA